MQNDNSSKNIAKCFYRVDKNSVWRCYAEEEIILDNTHNSVSSREAPFIIEQEGRCFLFTPRRDDNIPPECDYALLINHQINAASFKQAKFEIKE